MKSIGKRACILVLAALFVASASGAKPKLISEEEAKKAGLAFINRVFDANETEATVKLVTEAGTSYVDGKYVRKGDEQPVSYYVVSASEIKDGLYRYYASVNAETGVAYSAERDNSLVPEMTSKQRSAWKEAYGNGDVNSFDFTRVYMDCTNFAHEWIPEKFELKAKFLGFVDSGSAYDKDGINENFYVVIRDGTIYHVTIAWPQRTVLEATMLNQTRPTEDIP